MSRRDRGTLLGGLKAELEQMLLGETKADSMEAGFKKREKEIDRGNTAIKSRKAALDKVKADNAHRSNIIERASSKAIDSIYTIGTFRGITANYCEYHSAYVAALKVGTGVHTQYSNGHRVITKAEFERLSVQEQNQYEEESWFNYRGQRVNLKEAAMIDQGLLETNTANYYEQIVNGQIVDYAVIADRDAYRLSTGRELESTMRDLRRAYGEAHAQIMIEEESVLRATADVSTKSQSLSEEKESFAYRRARANADRWK